MLKKPKALKKGGTIGLIAPAGPIKQHENVQNAVQTVESYGFKVKLGKHATEIYGYLAGNDEMRAADLNGMFADESVDAIFCLKGGYGTPRLFHLLDMECIRSNPKILVGFSDITALHLMIGKFAPMVTFHGPMAGERGYGSNLSDYSKNSLFKAIMTDTPLGKLENPPEDPMVCFSGGKAKGLLTGGNLSLITASLGTPYEIEAEGKILLIEDVGEEPYQIDRMLTQLKNSGKLDACAGIILGDWNNCQAVNTNPSLTLEQVLADILLPLGKPVIANCRTGHCEPMQTVPLGVCCELDADNREIRITESSCS